MKKLNIIICLPFLMFNLKSFAGIEGRYVVTSSPCSILFSARDGAKISRAFGVNSEIEIKQDKRFVSAALYENYYIAGLKDKSYTHHPSFDRQYKKNTKLRFFYRTDMVKTVQTTKSFNYKIYRDFCHSYDFSGLSCAVGLFNPRNWIPIKKVSPLTKVVTKVEVIKKDDLLIDRYILIENKKKQTHYCELQKI
jgi:hypothetical protein